ncbi:Uncharacterised protein [Staphylococcus aureus]|nr:Uncharacterised protein [Staphylococcus aureus]
MIGNAIPNTKTVLLTKLNDNELVNAPITIINTIAKTTLPIIRPYFFFSAGVNGLVGFIPTLPKFLRLKSTYHTKPNAIPTAAIKNPPWKFLTLTKCCKIIGDNNAPILTDI